MKGLFFTHEGELTEKGKKKLERLKKSSKVSIERIKKEYKNMLSSDDDFLIK